MKFTKLSLLYLQHSQDLGHLTYKMKVSDVPDWLWTFIWKQNVPKLRSRQFSNSPFWELEER